MSVREFWWKTYWNAKLKLRMRYWLYKDYAKLQSDYAAELKFLKKKIAVIPYECKDVGKVKIYREGDMYYGILSGRKLFFPESMEKGKCYTSMLSLLREQSIESPHKYIASDADIEKGTILVDCGSAEGNFSLSVIDKVDEVILFEPETIYNKCLKRTFDFCIDKIKIVNKFVSDKVDEQSITLDRYFENVKGKKIFIKMDLEGHALEALGGGIELLRNNDCSIACACYHYNEEAEDIERFFREELPNYKTEFTDGYMLLWWEYKDTLKYPYFRRGMLRAKKQ